MKLSMKISIAGQFVLTALIALLAVTINVSFLIAPHSAVAQQNPTAFEDAIHEDVVAVVSIDLTEVNLLKLHKMATGAGLLAEENANEEKLMLATAQGVIGTLTDNGVERISILLRLSDVGTYSPLWVARIKKGGDIAQGIEALEGTLEGLPLPKQVLQAKGDLIFGGPSQAEIDSLFTESDSANRRLTSAIETMRQHQVGILVFGNPETRRVIREMLPSLPQPFDEVTGELIADHTDWGGLFLDLPPTTDLKIIIQATDDNSAQTIGKLATSTMQYALRQSPPAVAEAVGETILTKITPEIIQRRVVLDAENVLSDQAFIQKIVGLLKDSAMKK